MPSPVQTEIGVMIAALIGAWFAKVVAVAVYITWSRRRLERQQAQEALARMSSSGGALHKPAPAAAVAALPVLSYSCAVRMQRHGSAASAASSSSGGTEARSTSTEQQAAGRDAAGACMPQPGVPQHQPEQQQQQQQQAPGGSSSPGTASTSAAASGSGASSGPEEGEEEEEGDVCAICFCEYQAATLVKQLPCRHFFHVECACAWLERDNSCPLCKSPVHREPPLPPPPPPPPQQQQQQPDAGVVAVQVDALAAAPAAPAPAASGGAAVGAAPQAAAPSAEAPAAGAAAERGEHTIVVVRDGSGR